MANALLYDFLLANGGAEQLALTTVELFPELELQTGFLNPELFQESVAHTLTTPVSHPALQAIRMLYAFRHQTGYLSNYETVIYSGSYAPVAVWNHVDGKNIYYCHTPPRFVYDLKDFYLQQIPYWQRPVLHALIEYVRPRFEQAIDQMDTLIANSQNVRQRLLDNLNVDSTVIYPPVNTEQYKWLSTGEYYLSTARLEPYKRVDLIVEAFVKMPDKQLVVTSGGSDLPRLKRIANNATNIRFTGWASQQQLIDLVGRAIATIYLPMNEDFGISPVESMAAGKPVIGAAEGGLLETVIDGETGVLIAAVDDLQIIEAVNKLSNRQALQMRHACVHQAQQFTVEQYFQKMQLQFGN
ncbi:MAG: glycosyltransferase [Methylococcales bacterium]